MWKLSTRKHTSSRKVYGWICMGYWLLKVHEKEIINMISAQEDIICMGYWLLKVHEKEIINMISAKEDIIYKSEP